MECQLINLVLQETECWHQLEPVGNGYYPLWTLPIHDMATHSMPKLSGICQLEAVFCEWGPPNKVSNWQWCSFHLLELQKHHERLECVTVAPMCLCLRQKWNCTEMSHCSQEAVHWHKVTPKTPCHIIRLVTWHDNNFNKIGKFNYIFSSCKNGEQSYVF